MAPVTTLIYANEKVPFFCPIRYLLAYLYVIGYKSGAVFPSKQELQTNTSGIFKTRLAYTDFSRAIQKGSIVALPSIGSDLTPQAFRKTYYLQAIWGGAKIEEAMRGARYFLFNRKTYR